MTVPGSSEWSEEYRRLIVLAMAGKLAELGQALAQPSSLVPEERLELASVAEFQAGKFRPTPRPPRLQVFVWWVWTTVPAGRRLILLMLGGLFGLAQLLSLRPLSFAALRRRLAPAIVHYRYTNFVGGLVGSALLYVAARPERNPVEKAYYLGLIAMFECLSGRTDYGLATFERSFDRLSILNDRANRAKICDPAVYERFLSVSALRAFYLGNSGHHGQAYKAYDAALDLTRTHGRYVFVEMYIHSMQMFSDLETLNAESLARSAANLRRTLGQYFAGPFALRASAYTSLVATINGNADFARQQIALSEKWYSESAGAVELSRYHFLRALIHLDLSEPASASYHSNRAAAFLSKVPGSRFHRADAILQELELRLRGRIRAGAPPLGRAEVTAILRALKKVVRLVRGSPLFDLRVRGTQALLTFVQRDFIAVEQALPGLVEAAGWFSNRWRRVLHEIDIRQDGRATVATSRDEVNRRRETTVLERFVQLMKTDGAEKEVSDLLVLLTGGHDCRALNDPESTGPAIEMTAGGERLTVRISTSRGAKVFVLEQPLVDVRFDARARELLELAISIIELAQSKRALMELERQAAIAKTTQMLAHDVRKPFTMVKMMLEVLKSTSDPSQLRQAAADMIPETEQAIAAVSALLEDVMDVGRNAEVVPEACEPVALLDAALTEVFQIHPGVDVQIVSEVQHTRAVMAESRKVHRVLSNIIANAVEATGEQGKIWLQTRDCTEREIPFVEFSIRNSGSYVPPEVRERLFEAFFTAGKQGGTGLGLAIAQKHISRHGGRIWCHSSPDSGTAFLFTLPTAGPGSASTSATRTLGRHSSEYRFMPDRRLAARQPEPQELPVPATGLTTEQHRLRVLIVDDQEVYVAALARIVEQDAGLAGAVSVRTATGYGPALAIAREGPLDLVICDVDLGPGMDGIQLAVQIRGLQPQARVCIHSNRGLSAQALGMNSDDVIVKPMSESRFLNLLKSVGRPIQDSLRPQIALIDDSRTAQRAWRRAADDANVLAFPQPQAFFAAVEARPSLLASLAAVVVDLHFEDETSGDGMQAVRRLRGEYAYTGPLFICSSDPRARTAGAADLVDGVLEKQGHRYADLMGFRCQAPSSFEG